MAKFLFGLLGFGALVLQGVVCTPVNPAMAVALKKTAKPVTGARFAPHRAIYSIKLFERRDGVSVTGVNGRMVFEVTGSPCAGFTQNMRMVTRIADERGQKTVSDIRSSTWEQGNGKRFRFNSSQYFDAKLVEMVSGAASRAKKGAVKVRLTKPGPAALEFPNDILFPTQHSLAILKSAEAGKKWLQARIYDGSEQGQGFYRTFAFIGKKVLPASLGAVEQPDRFKRSKALGLSKMPSWPVAISYYEHKNGAGKVDATPSYELSFRLYPNGVSRRLMINYGEFSVYGTLKKITYLRRPKCR